MSTYVMLSLDLNFLVDSESRNKFYESLEASGWDKSTVVDTVWTRLCFGGSTILGGGVGSFVIGDLGRALLAARIDRVSYIFQGGNSVAVGGELERPSHLARFR